MPKLSVIIPTHNEEKEISACLKSLESQSLKDFETIIVDDGSTDNTLQIIKSFPKIRLITGEHKGPGFSRNLGAKNAKGEILIFIDADMTFSKDYLKNLIAPIKKENIGTTHDEEIVENIKNIWSRCWGRVRVSKKDADKVKVFRAIRKDKFLEMGGFDPLYGYADDQTFFFKYKIKPVVAPNTLCYHKNPETLSKVYRQSRWIGASIEHKLLESNPINFLSPIMLLLLSPLTIPVLSIKKCYQLKEPAIFPQMLIFMIARYFGTISGITRRIYLNKNTR